MSPCHFPLHPSGTGRSVDLSWLHTVSTSLHRPHPSKMPTGQAGRFLLICPGFAYPGKPQLEKHHREQTERRASAVLRDVGELEQSYRSSTASGLWEEAEHLGAGLCLSVSPGPTFCHAGATRQASGCAQQWVLLFGRQVRQLLQLCLRIIRARESSHPCISFPFTISILAGFPEILEQESVPQYPASHRGPEESHREEKGRSTWEFPQPPLPGSPRGFSSASPSSLAWSPLSSLHPQHRGPKVPCGG